MDSILAELRKIPPVTRFLTLSLVGITGSSLLNLVSAYKLVYVQRFVFSKLELWRLYTSFFLGSGGINFIFEIAMLYRSADQLESGPYARKSGDLAWQLFLSAGAIIAASYPVNTMVFLRPFMLCIIYLSSALAPPGSQTSFFGMITFPVKYYPYVMLGLDLLTGGPGAAAQSLPGAVVGHLWWWGVWQTRALEELGKAPKWLAAWFGDRSGSLGEGSSGSTGTGVHVVPPRSRAQPAAGGSGSFRGAGHRLGSG